MAMDSVCMLSVAALPGDTGCTTKYPASSCAAGTASEGRLTDGAAARPELLLSCACDVGMTS
jgi:hypothetical protein